MLIHWRVLLFILCCSVWLSGCSVNPATGTPDLVFMSESEEIAMGKKMHEKLIKTTPMYQDEALLTYLNEVGQNIAKHSDRPNLTYHFNIIDSPDINAFALPGGYIYVNRGLLAYLDNEAQLAAVLSHEIGHVAARHVVRQDTARKGANVLSIFSVFTTGSAVVGDVTNLWSTAAVKGYGRDMELEADGFGAKYLYKTGYNPQAMVDTISVLKDQEKFARYRAKQEGRKQQSYHGVFASHPRNDVRLHQVIETAGKLPDNHSNQDRADIYRAKTEGLVYGINYEAELAKQAIPKNTYVHKKLGFAFKYPEGWQVTNSRKEILVASRDNKNQLHLTVARRQVNVSPAQHLRHFTQAKKLLRAEDFNQFGLQGHTGIVPASNNQTAKRVAVIYQGGRAYLFQGELVTNSKQLDQNYLTTIRSFALYRAPVRANRSQKIHYVKANQYTSMKALARASHIGLYAEQQLRLLNGLYPNGKPKPGQWLKIVK